MIEMTLYRAVDLMLGMGQNEKPEERGMTVGSAHDIVVADLTKAGYLTKDGGTDVYRFTDKGWDLYRALKALEKAVGEN